MDARLRNTLEEALGEPLSLAGSGLLRASSGKEYFLKTGPASEAFRCEANGLRELARSGAIPVAEAVTVGDDFILTGYIARRAPAPGFFEEFGRSLARLHRFRGESFGFYEDNFIGANPQSNLAQGEERTDWAAFYFRKRLLPQYRLAERNGYATARLRRGFLQMESRLESILQESEEPPCLLHGDLWNGNYLCGPEDRAILIDPAVYYGHREADLAMTRLFGGFPESFYRAYREEYPLPEGWEYRENLYKLYHLLNHLNLFGAGYLSDVEGVFSSY